MSGYQYSPTGTDGDDLVVGTTANNTLDGGANSDVVLGDAGDDTIRGGGNRDILRGGSGNDSLSGGDAADIILGGSGDDVLEGDAGNDLMLGGAGNDSLMGGTGNDTLIGGAGDDTITGGDGEDTFMFAEDSGNDTITDFDVDDDTIDLSLMNAAIAFSDLDIQDLTDGRTGATISHSSFGTITVLGVSASDLTAGVFVLPDGTTTEITTDENDTVQRYMDPMEGTGDSDILVDRSNDTRIVAKDGDDLVLAGEGDDKLEGGAGNDTLLGEEGDDSITGGANDDWLHGGSGNDTFVFEAGHGNDTIRDFTDGEDLIDLTSLTGITEFNDLTITDDGGTAVVDLSSHGGGTIRLEGFDDDDLDATDFVFYDSTSMGDVM